MSSVSENWEKAKEHIPFLSKKQKSDSYDNDPEKKALSLIAKYCRSQSLLQAVHPDDRFMGFYEKTINQMIPNELEKDKVDPETYTTIIENTLFLLNNIPLRKDRKKSEEVSLEVVQPSAEHAINLIDEVYKISAKKKKRIENPWRVKLIRISAFMCYVLPILAIIAIIISRCLYSKGNQIYEESQEGFGNWLLNTGSKVFGHDRPASKAESALSVYDTMAIHTLVITLIWIGVLTVKTTLHKKQKESLEQIKDLEFLNNIFKESADSFANVEDI